MNDTLLKHFLILKEILINPVWHLISFFFAMKIHIEFQSTFKAPLKVIFKWTQKINYLVLQSSSMDITIFLLKYNNSE